MDNLIIRKATVEDAAAISKVLLQAFLQFKQFYTDKAFAATTISANIILQRMDEGNVWFAFLNDDIIDSFYGTLIMQMEKIL